MTEADAEELKVPISRLSIAATHDHNTPHSKAARQAIANLKPACIKFATGKAHLNTNRDQKIGTSYKMGYAPEGPTDRTVALLPVTDPAGQPIAV